MAETNKQELDKVLEKEGLTPEDLDNLSEEEKAELLKGSEPAKPEEGKPQEDDKDRQINGLLSDLQRERAAKREQKEQLDALNERLAEAEESVKEFSKTKEEDLGIEEDEYLQAKHAKKLLKQEIARVEKGIMDKVSPTIQNLEGRLLSISENETKTKYAPAKVGKDLAYDEVLKNGLGPLLKDNPEYRQVIRRAANPAEEAYRIGLTHPKFQDLMKKRSQQELVDKLSRGKPKTGVGGSGATKTTDLKTASVDDLLKLSDEELDKLAKSPE